jgi:hypothetical protein
MSIANGQTIPTHLPSNTVTSTIFDVPDELGWFLTTQSSNSTWTLPLLDTIASGSFLWIRNGGTGTVTLVAHTDDTISGPATVTSNHTMLVTTDGTSTWHVALQSPMMPIPPTSTNSSFQITTSQILINNTSYATIGWFPWFHGFYSNYTEGYVVINTEVPQSGFTLRVLDTSTSTALLTVVVSTSGSYNYSFSSFPVGNCRLAIQVRKDQIDTQDPTLYGLTMQFA